MIQQQDQFQKLFDQLSEQKASLLIAGGLGFVGKNLLEFIFGHKIQFSKIVTADKSLPSISYLPEDLTQAFKQNNLIHCQIDLAQSQQVEKMFKEHGPFTYVVNLACETKFGYDAQHYKAQIEDISKNLANCCVNYPPARFIEVSTAYVYSSGSKKKTEQSKPAPQRLQDISKLQCELYLQKLGAEKKLKYLILRPAKIYGKYDYMGLGQRFIATAIYKNLNQAQTQLWSDDQYVSTVHVKDVCKAIIYFLKMGNDGEVYNLADSGYTQKKHINDIMSQIFKCKIICKNNFLSNIAWFKITDMLKDVNEMHIEQWISLCAKYGITTTPLDIMLFKENVDDFELRIDGNAITSRFGFHYDYPVLKLEYVEEILSDFIKRNLFPNIFGSEAKQNTDQNIQKEQQVQDAQKK